MSYKLHLLKLKNQKKFKLLSRCIWCHRFCSIKHADVSKLLVGDAHYGHMPELWKKRLDTLYMNLSIFHACTMPYVDGHLEHGESIALQILTKQGIFFLILLRFGRQIEKHQNPHNAIFTKPVHKNQYVISQDMIYGATLH